ncbi:alanine--tRNA ligase [Patescibacteria group bacterium]|nr:alanine--tRNA ligase [Patescibacteria group bacterium]MCL5797925.1 alanine--tRNA ligase [Patescibacteria group bacterium]
MTHTDLRKRFIRFFTSSPRNHKEIPSAPLVPENDPTVLFITAGMHPLVPYLMGETHPLGKRLVDVQKSMRTDDIEEVGDLRHFTFFEMLGNWSLGDYFKKEAISWSFEFLTSSKWLHLDPSKIYISVFEGDSDALRDDESIGFWQEAFEKVGIEAKVGNPKDGMTPGGRIFPYPKSKNWWGPAGTTGPCGPDTEMFFDTGLSMHNSETYGPVCHINCDCGRFVEIWNDVFMQYNKKPDGNFEPLQQKNVDTGMGMERLTAILEWLEGKIPDPDPFRTELFNPVTETINKVYFQKYGGENTKSLRIIADHIRAAVFIISDGVVPSNKERGYVLRKLIRRAVRHLQLIGVKNPFISPLAMAMIETYKSDYPELSQNKKLIKETMEQEETKFLATLSRGLKEIEKHSILTGKIAFDIYQSYGFPWEMTAEIAHEKGQQIDRAQFETEFKKHQELSRTATKGVFKGGLQDHSETTTSLHTATHLLQEALREILGNHVRQKGSHITAERLRFDFSHPAKMTPEEIKKTEDLVNAQIKKNLPVSMKVIDLKEAANEGALTVPGVNYPEKVKVYTIGNFSREVCGGPHVDFTGKMGTFKIIKEEAASANVRRVYAILTI